MAWRLFRWGSRGEWYETDYPGIYAMAHIFIRDGIRVVLQGYNTYASEFINVIGVQVPGGGPAGFGDCLGAANAVKGWYENTYRNMIPASMGISQIVATTMASSPGPQAQVTSTVVGGRLGTPLTDTISFCLKLGTNLSGRRNRGRFFTWPAVQTDLFGADVFQLAYVNAMILALGDLGNRIASAGYVWAIPSLTDGAMKPIIRVVAVDHVVDTQRRRKVTAGR